MTPALRMTFPVGVMIQCRGHQAGHEAIELDTGIAKACDLDESRRPKTQASTGGQREKINAARRDVFSDIARRYRKAPRDAAPQKARRG